MAYQSKQKLLSQEYRWLIDLVEKDLVRTQAEHEKTPHPLFALRIANMEALKGKLNGLRKYEIQRMESMQR